MSRIDHQEIKDNPVFILRSGWLGLLSVRYHPFVSIIVLFGLFAAPGALMAFFSGLFFGSAVPTSAPLAERMGNWVGASVARPVGATLVVATETTYRAQLASYKQPAKQDKTVPLDKATLVKLQNFSKNNGVLVNYVPTK